MSRRNSYSIAFKLREINEYDLIKSKRENLEDSPDQTIRRRVSQASGEYPDYLSGRPYFACCMRNLMIDFENLYSKQQHEVNDISVARPL
ncbi:unnamed protein product [Brachionus calyciflorus]|uniref:Uncharacterized protein n=1 Tax=Brachionus calyciflorus TaxID=104777 RepID=A0A814AL93_9BILA|nr:unnamed protein product [Brachionus calyciflorus]